MNADVRAYWLLVIRFVRSHRVRKLAIPFACVTVVVLGAIMLRIGATASPRRSESTLTSDPIADIPIATLKERLIANLESIRIRCTYAQCSGAAGLLHPSASPAILESMTHLQRYHVLALDGSTNAAFDGVTRRGSSAQGGTERCITLKHGTLVARGCVDRTHTDRLLLRELSGTFSQHAELTVGSTTRH